MGECFNVFEFDNLSYSHLTLLFGIFKLPNFAH